MAVNRSLTVTPLFFHVAEEIFDFRGIFLFTQQRQRCKSRIILPSTVLFDGKIVKEGNFASACNTQCRLKFLRGFLVFVGGSEDLCGADPKLQLLVFGQTQCAKALQRRSEGSVAG